MQDLVYWVVLVLLLLLRLPTINAYYYTHTVVCNHSKRLLQQLIAASFFVAARFAVDSQKLAFREKTNQIIAARIILIRILEK